MGSSFPALSVQPPQQPDILGTFGRLMQIKNAQQQQQLGAVDLQQHQLDLKNAQTAQADQQKLTASYQQSGGDVQKFLDLARQSGVSEAGIGKAQKTLTDAVNVAATADEKKFKLLGQQHQMMGDSLAAINAASPQDQPAVWAAEHDKLTNSGIFDAQHLQQFAQYPGPDAVRQLSSAYKTQDQILAQAKEKREADAQKATTEHNAATEVPESVREFQQWQKMSPTDQKAFAAYKASTKGLDVQEANDWLSKNPGKTLSDYGKYKATLVPAFNFNLQGGAGGGLNQTALDQAAQRYAQTGVLPAMGMGSAGAQARKQIMNRAGELAPNGSIAVNSAEYQANTDSLKSLQKNFDQVTAFENTAGKNLDQFLTTAKKVVDSGSPWVNAPLRTVNKGALGSADLAAFDAARVTALTEISKVLNSSNASGVLSDSARQEVGQLIGPNATLKQIVSAANILKTDMGNRHQAYQEQIADIQKRLGGTPASTTPAPSSGAAPAKVLSQAAIAKAAKDHGVSVDEATKQAKAAGYTIQ